MCACCVYVFCAAVSTCVCASLRYFVLCVYDCAYECQWFVHVICVIAYSCSMCVHELCKMLYVFLRCSTVVYYVLMRGFISVWYGSRTLVWRDCAWSLYGWFNRVVYDCVGCANVVCMIVCDCVLCCVRLCIGVCFVCVRFI